MSIGQRIIELRKAINLTQNQLAKEMEISRQAVSKWETDQTIPDALNMIRLAEILDTDIEYLSTGRRNFGRRPPLVLKSVETVEKIVERPVVQQVETIVEKIVEIPIVKYVEKPVIKRIYRNIYVRNPLEFVVCAFLFLLIGIFLGLLF